MMDSINQGQRAKRYLATALVMLGATGCLTKGTVAPDGTAGSDGTADASFVDDLEYCGNDMCDTNETCESCPEECGGCPPVCGDGLCEVDETCTSCPVDCPVCAVCPSGVCEPGEDCHTCAADCGPCPAECGNSDCEAGEDCLSCPQDCPDCATCPDGECSEDDEEDCSNCSADCGVCPAYCGNFNCDPGESCATCPDDCGICSICPSGVCEPGEDCTTCSADCGTCPVTCGNGNCEPGEDSANCPADCPVGSTCPNGTCEIGEFCTTCAADCGACVATCGNGNCELGEDCGVCPFDCGSCAPVCGDGVCGTNEHCSSCPADCGACPPICGDLVCHATESCINCAVDCGACPPFCGDLHCEPGETCGSCPSDCGTCPGTCNPACPADQSCLPGPQGMFCSACDTAACAIFGAWCCPSNAPYGGCTDALSDPNNCGSCGIVCAAGQVCSWGQCAPPENGVLPTSTCLAPVSNSSSGRNIVFVTVADTHVNMPFGPPAQCHSRGNFASDQNVLLVQALNSIGSHKWKARSNWSYGSYAKEGQNISKVRGVIIPGDLTEHGSEPKPGWTPDCEQWQQWRSLFGLCGGDGALAFPVFEGYGNHDFPRYPGPDTDHHPVIDHIHARNRWRTGGCASGDCNRYRFTPGEINGHYAWKWDDIWFVQLNLKPASGAQAYPGSAGNRYTKPHGAVSFLDDFLSTLSQNSSRQIVLVSHYGPQVYKGSRLPKRSLNKLCKKLKKHINGGRLSSWRPVTAWIQGHNHRSWKVNDFICPKYQSIRIRNYSPGTAHYIKKGKIRFTVFRLGSNRVETMNVAVAPGDPIGPWTTKKGRRYQDLNSP